MPVMHLVSRYMRIYLNFGGPTFSLGLEGVVSTSPTKVTSEDELDIEKLRILRPNGLEILLV